MKDQIQKNAARQKVYRVISFVCVGILAFLFAFSLY